MEHTPIVSRKHAVLRSLSSLPQKILFLHGADRMAEYVLHDLCHKECFNIKKAAFFVDNPDFNCFKGVVGYDQNQDYALMNAWEDPDEFSLKINSCTFNNKVRSLEFCSIEPKVNGSSFPNDSFINDIADQLGIEEPGYQLFPLKHQNHGIFLYEKMHADIQDLHDEVARGACFLGFCPLF